MSQQFFSFNQIKAGCRSIFLLPMHMYLFRVELGPVILIFHTTNMIRDFAGLSAGPFLIQTANGYLIQEILGAMVKHV